MKRRLVFLLAVLLPLTAHGAEVGEIIFAGMLRPGEYRVTCDGEQTVVSVGADGVLAADCDQLHAVRMAGGGSVLCKERER